MNTFRIWLLLLLALLLPLRGAVAAGMALPAPGAGSHAEGRAQPARPAHCLAGEAALQVSPDDSPAESHDHAMQGPDHPTSSTDAAAGSADPKADADQADACNLCCAFCSATPLVSSLPAWAPPQAFATVDFPELHAPAPTFLSDGQERPPRGC